MNSMARWMVYSFLSALTVAIVAFPAPEPARRVDQAYHTSMELRRAQMKWMVESERLRRADSREIARQAVGTSPATPRTGSFELMHDKTLPRTVVDGVKDVATRMYTTARRDTAVRVVVVLTIDTGATVAGVHAHRAGWWSSTDTFFPGAVAPNACVVVVRTTPKLTFNARNTDFGGAPCDWYGVYGIPGRGVATFLDSTEYKALTIYDGHSSHRRDSFFEYAVSNDARVLKCRAGDRPMCELMLLGAPPRRDFDQMSGLVTPKWAGSGRNYGPNSDYLPGELLTRIQRELGFVDFARIWKSDKPFAESFADVRGVSLGNWIHDFVVSKLDTRDRGPLPRPRVWLAFGIAVPVLIAIGAYGASRRSGLG